MLNAHELGMEREEDLRDRMSDRVVVRYSEVNRIMLVTAPARIPTKEVPADSKAKLHRTPL